MANTHLLALLAHFDAQSQEMHDAAKQWMAEAKNEREHEFAKALLRHARGAHVAIAAGRYEIEVAQS